MKKLTDLYYIEVTDTFGGDANYAWVTRHIIRANSQRGAIQRFSKMSGINWRYDYGERYNSKSGAICLFIDCIDNDEANDYASQYKLQTNEI